jgi:uncharacterized protein (TIGR03435 family)
MNRDNRATWLVYVAIWVLPATAVGQSFEVSSVKFHNPQDESFSPPACANGRFSVSGTTVHGILGWANDLRADQYIALEASLPVWARTGAYDIEAIADKPVSEADCKAMVHRLFEDRFRMKSRWKTVTGSRVYELRVAPKGHKLKLAAPGATGCGVHISNAGQERPCDRYQWPLAPKPAMTMKELARVLTIYKSRYPVFDLTGLTGAYKIDLSFTTRSNDLDYPPLEVALQQQLGLELRETKGDVELLIVDSIERPTAN